MRWSRRLRARGPPLRAHPPFLLAAVIAALVVAFAGAPARAARAAVNAADFASRETVRSPALGAAAGALAASAGAPAVASPRSSVECAAGRVLVPGLESSEDLARWFQFGLRDADAAAHVRAAHVRPAEVPGLLADESGRLEAVFGRPSRLRLRAIRASLGQLCHSELLPPSPVLNLHAEHLAAEELVVLRWDAGDAALVAVPSAVPGDGTSSPTLAPVLRRVSPVQSHVIRRRIVLLDAAVSSRASLRPSAGTAGGAPLSRIARADDLISFPDQADDHAFTDRTLYADLRALLVTSGRADDDLADGALVSYDITAWSPAGPSPTSETEQVFVFVDARHTTSTADVAAVDDDDDDDHDNNNSVANNNAAGDNDDTADADALDGNDTTGDRLFAGERDVRPFRMSTEVELEGVLNGLGSASSGSSSSASSAVAPSSPLDHTTAAAVAGAPTVTMTEVRSATAAAAAAAAASSSASSATTPSASSSLPAATSSSPAKLPTAPALQATSAPSPSSSPSSLWLGAGTALALGAFILFGCVRAEDGVVPGTPAVIATPPVPPAGAGVNTVAGAGAGPLRPLNGTAGLRVGLPPARAVDESGWARTPSVYNCRTCGKKDLHKIWTAHTCGACHGLFCGSSCGVTAWHLAGSCGSKSKCLCAACAAQKKQG